MRMLGLRRKILLQNRPINLRQLLQILDRRMLVDLVHCRADKAEIHHRAIILDEARVGRAARRGDFRFYIRGFLYRFNDEIDEWPALRKVRFARGLPLDLEARARAAFFSLFSISRFRLEGVCLSLKRILKRAFASAGMTLNAVFPLSTETISKFDGWNSFDPLSKGFAVSASSIASIFGIGLSARPG